MSFTGRHVLVTGASTGIGRATATMLAKRGATVSLIARRADVLAEAVAEIGNAAHARSADVADRTALRGAIDALEATSGPIDGLFANAGSGGSFAAIGDYGDDNWDAVIATNLTSVFASIRQVLPGMIARKRGSIVVTGSLSCERGMANNAGYVASKHGVLGLARAAAVEAAPHNVRVNCVLPGLIETPLLMGLGTRGHEAELLADMGRAVPQGRIGTADEIAEVVCFLLSDAASHVNWPGLGSRRRDPRHADARSIK